MYNRTWLRVGMTVTISDRFLCMNNKEQKEELKKAIERGVLDGKTVICTTDGEEILTFDFS